jgi:Holliday junction resolvase RusA-like endonuclease
MPPSENAQYMPIGFRRPNGKIGARLIPTKELTDYQEKEFAMWQKMNLPYAAKAGLKCREWLLQGDMLGLHIWAIFPSNRIWTQKAAPRRLDVANRIKALQDCIATMLQLDDSQFWYSGAVKIESMKLDQPICMVRLFPIKPLSVPDLSKMLQDAPLAIF